MNSLIIHADFDGTLFDPNPRIFLSWFYNVQTAKLITDSKSTFILNTGRPVWDAFSHVQIALVGMKQPDVVIAGAGTTILWKTSLGYKEDQNWLDRMKKSQWDKERVLHIVTPIISEIGGQLFDTKNPFMTRVWIYNISINKLNEVIKEIQKKLPMTEILITEQILLPNTKQVFSGYLLFVPTIAGKERASLYVNDQLTHKKKTGFALYFGDAYVDVPMLKMGEQKESAAYALNPTALARQSLEHTHVTIVPGSPPKSILKIVSSHVGIIKTPQNSPQRKLFSPLLSIIERLINPKLSPDQLSHKGLSDVQKALVHPKGGLFYLIRGHLFDALDGIRARRRPDLASINGQLVDVYTDRMKEFLQLKYRNHLDAAFSCFLPSIARAQAEAMGKTVLENDPAGGSALSRSMKLIKSYFLNSIGQSSWSTAVDQSIFSTNMQTYKNRKNQTKDFSWSSTASYDKKSVDRLLFLIGMLQDEYKALKREYKPSDPALSQALNEYLKVDTRGKIELHAPIA